MPNYHNSELNKSLRRMVVGSSCLVLALLAIMMFSPLSEQYYDEGGGAIREVMVVDSLDQEEDLQSALIMTDSLIAEKSEGLRRFAYFDRFLPDNEQYDATVKREEIYELQWERIEILNAMGDDENLREALKDYCKIIGYHQDEAKAMLNQINAN